MDRHTKITIKYRDGEFNMRLSPREPAQCRDIVISICVLTGLIRTSTRKNWIHRIKGITLEDVRSCDALRGPFSYTYMDFLRDGKYGLLVVFNRDTGKPEVYYIRMWQHHSNVDRLEREFWRFNFSFCVNTKQKCTLKNYNRSDKLQKKVCTKDYIVKVRPRIRYNCQERQLAGKTMRSYKATRKK